MIAGNGNDIVNANGGLSNVSLGYGNDGVSATGSGSSVTISAQSFSHDSVTVGSSDTASATRGTAAISGVAGNSFYLSGLQPISTLLLSGNNDMAFITGDSSLTVALNQAQSGAALIVQGDEGNTYGGSVLLSQFNGLDSLTLNDLVGGLNGQSLNSYQEVLENISAGPFSDTLHLAGGGSIVFAAGTGFTSNEFHCNTASSLR